ncbi:type I glyceraldehyde-3-phosphate dehydrogenase, partial [Escherichia coli]|nr:type I glyceraldehyde-3-phosphate dehydrogenase [Escherichia coli]
MRFEDGYLIVGDRKIQILAEREPAKLPWGELNIDVVVESTGRFTNAKDAALHLEAGAKRVLVSAPSKGADVTIARGVNQD